jgi:hypothetical protein
VNSPFDFAAEYREMTDEQLMEVAGEGGLVDEAQLALRAEMANRKLTTEMVRSYRSEMLRYWSADNARAESLKPITGNRLPLGKFMLFGRSYLSEDDKAHGIEVRTKWFTFRGFPIFPVASYRFSREQLTTGLIEWNEEKPINQIPLNWNQAIRTWFKTAGLFILGAGLVVIYLAWQEKSHK